MNVLFFAPVRTYSALCACEFGVVEFQLKFDCDPIELRVIELWLEFNVIMLASVVTLVIIIVLNFD